MTRKGAEEVIARIGLTAMALHYEEAIEIAMRGWPAWRIAQYYQASPRLVYDLGGPEPPPDDKR